jgi:tRNA (uracil-5-)-methyltransferase TRM9
MRDKLAQKLLRKVKDSYNVIANEFSDTRHQIWDDFRFFNKYLGDQSDIIDLGCGNGRLLKYLYQQYLNNNFKYIGIDNSEKLLLKAHHLHPEAIFVCGDQLDLPIADRKADLIFDIAAFHHLPSKKLRLKALKEMKRVLKAEGVVIITVWNLWQKKYFNCILKAFLRYLISFGNYHFNDFFVPWKNSTGKTISKRYYHAFFPLELIRLVKKSGLEIVETFSSKKGKKTSFLNGYTFCIIAKKLVTDEQSN